jgi:hypothetical protein
VTGNTTYLFFSPREPKIEEGKKKKKRKVHTLNRRFHGRQFKQQTQVPPKNQYPTGGIEKMG